MCQYRASYRCDTLVAVLNVLTVNSTALPGVAAHVSGAVLSSVQGPVSTDPVRLQPSPGRRCSSAGDIRSNMSHSSSPSNRLSVSTDILDSPRTAKAAEYQVLFTGVQTVQQQRQRAQVRRTLLQHCQQSSNGFISLIGLHVHVFRSSKTNSLNVYIF